MRRKPRPVEGEAPPPGRLRVAGVLTLAGALALVALAFARPNPFADTSTVDAVFADAAGISVDGADVRMDGVVVGEITETERAADDARVEMELEPEAGRLGADAGAELRPRLAFEGTAFVELEPGSASGAPLGPEGIPLSRTRNYVAFDQAARAAQPEVRRAFQGDVEGVAGALEGPARDGIRQTLAEAPSLTRDLPVVARAARGPEGIELAGAIGAFARTADTVAARRENLVPLLRAGERTTAALTVDGAAPLDRTLADLPATLEELDSGGRRLRGTVNQLDLLASDVEPGLRELTPALREVRPLLREARPVAQRAPAVVADLRAALAEGERATPGARGLLTALEPSLELLDQSLLPALAEDTPLGRPAYLQFLNVFQGGGGASRPFQKDENRRAGRPIDEALQPLVDQLEALEALLDDPKGEVPEEFRDLIPSGAGTVLFEELDSSVRDEIIEAIEDRLALLRRRLRAATGSLTTPDNLGDGHLIRFGARFYSGIGPPAPRCDDVEELNPAFAETAREEGLCTP